MERDLDGIFFGKAGHGRRFRAAVLIGPGTPVPTPGVGAKQVGVQCLEPGMRFQHVATVGPEPGQARALIRRGGREPGAQGGQAGAAGGGPIDQLHRFPRRIGHVQGRVQYVQHQPAAGRVRAKPVRVGRELRVHRADRDGRRPMRPGSPNEVLQASKVAQAAVPRPPQRIKLHGKRPRPVLRMRIRDRPAAGGCDGQHRLRHGGAQAVVANLTDARQCAAGHVHVLDRAVFQHDLHRAVGNGQLDRCIQCCGYEWRQPSRVLRQMQAVHHVRVRPGG